MIHAISTIAPAVERQRQYLNKLKTDGKYLSTDFTAKKIVKAFIQDRERIWADGCVDIPPSKPLNKDYLMDERRKRLSEDFEFAEINPRIKRMPGERPWGYYLQKRPYLGEVTLEFVDDYVPEGMLSNSSSERGWMLETLVRSEIEINGRYLYWQQIRDTGKLSEQPIPQIELRPNGFKRKPLDHLKCCLDLLTYKWREYDEVEHRIRAIEFFFDWLLWSLGHPLIEEFPLIENYCPEEDMESWRSDVHNYWVQFFDIRWFLLFPDDYFGVLLQEYSLIDKPPARYQDCLTVAKILFPDNKDYRTTVVVDPECETGRYSIALSNFTLKVIPVQLNRDLISAQACLLNLYLYCPWFVFPLDVGRQESENDVLARALQLVATKGLPSDYFVSNRPDERLQDYGPVVIYTRSTSPPKRERPELNSSSQPKLAAPEDFTQSLNEVNEILLDTDREIDELLSLVGSSLSTPEVLPLPASSSSDQSMLSLPMPANQEEFLPLPMPQSSQEENSVLPLPASAQAPPFELPLPMPQSLQEENFVLPLPAAAQPEILSLPMAVEPEVIDAEIVELDSVERGIQYLPPTRLDQSPF